MQLDSVSNNVHGTISQASPLSLESLCSEFVAAHAEWVESWTGVGDHIAKQIFARMVGRGHADRIADACVRIQPFGETFGPLLQTRVNFLGCDRLLNELVDIYELLGPHLAFVDLSGCVLGSAHPILTSIVEMTNLRCLIMRGCRLNDDSLRRLTLPISMTARGPAGLLMLDISNNPLISERSLPKIKAFRQLRKINVEGTGLAATWTESPRSGVANDNREKMIRSLQGLGLVAMSTIAVENNGWIADSGLWQRWLDLFQKRMDTLLLPPPRKRLRLL